MRSIIVEHIPPMSYLIRPNSWNFFLYLLASMFYPLFAIASQLSPELKSSGIEVLEADTFKLQCFQTLTGIWDGTLDWSLVPTTFNLNFSTGVKFLVVSDPKQQNLEILLKRIYELYADFALKNPFYSLEMPIRCELFETNLQIAIDQFERNGISNS